jgi:hypothetical protein
MRTNLRSAPPLDLGAPAGANTPRRQKRECFGNRLSRRDGDPDAGIGQINNLAGANCKANANPSVRPHVSPGCLPMIARLSARIERVGQRMSEV